MKIIEIEKEEENWEGKGLFSQELFDYAGAPEKGKISIKPYEKGWIVEVKLENKPANRKPEGLFLPFYLKEGTQVKFEKISTPIDPLNTIDGGNQRTHFVQSVLLKSRENGIKITPLDSGLVSINTPSLLRFSNKEGIKKLYFCLFNNLWGTNFKMWYEEDIIARFVIQPILQPLN